MSGNVTYKEFKNSLGQFVYDVNQVYLFSSVQQQMAKVFNFSKYDSSGNQNLQSILSVISPYQYQNSIFLSTADNNVIIDGRGYFNFNMLPNTSLTLKLYANRISNQDSLNSFELDNFKKWELQEGKPDFYNNYKNFV